MNMRIIPNFALEKFARRADRLNLDRFNRACRGIPIKIFIVKFGIMAVSVFILILPCLALADDSRDSMVSQDVPPGISATWENFIVKSDAGTYIAEVKASEIQQSVSPDKKTYTLAVYNVSIGNKQLFWQCNYDYDGYPTGILAEDGSTFVYVSKYYDDKKPMVKIYRVGTRIAFLYRGNFNINPANLKTDKNGRLWLDSDSQGYQFFYRGRIPPLLEITSYNKTKYYISLVSGEIVPN